MKQAVSYPSHTFPPFLQTPDPQAWSSHLREDTGQFLRQRRGVVGLSLVAMGALGLVVLQQMGIIKHQQ